MTQQPQQEYITIKKGDLIDFIASVGYRYEEYRSLNTDKITMEVSGYQNSGDVFLFEYPRPHTSTPQCPHWGINRIVPNDDNGEYSGFVDSWECCKPNNDTAIAQSARDQVLDDIVIAANFEQNRPITPFMISGWCNKLRNPQPQRSTHD